MRLPGDYLLPSGILAWSCEKTRHIGCLRKTGDIAALSAAGVMGPVLIIWSVIEVCP
jgi:hypothetical protein